MQDIKDRIRKNNRKYLELSLFAPAEDELQLGLTQIPSGSRFQRFWQTKPIIFAFYVLQHNTGSNLTTFSGK